MLTLVDQVPVPSDLSTSCVTLSSIPSMIPLSSSIPSPSLNRNPRYPIPTRKLPRNGPDLLQASNMLAISSLVKPSW